MPKTKIKTIKIVLDSPHLSVSDFNSIEQWENEGGTPGLPPSFWKSLAPIRPGDIIEIRKGDCIYENGQLLYLAEIDLLARDYSK